MYAGYFDLPWWGYALVALALTHVTIAAVTIYLHRHQSHHALELGPVPSHFFRFWLWLTTGMITREWAAIHRKHHAKVDTPDDPHSPLVLGLNRVLWGGVFLYVRESHKQETIERYGQGTPDDWLERRIYTPLHKVGIFVMLGIDLALFGIVPGTLIWAVQMVWIPFWAAGVINGVGHWWGYRNFACADASRNIVPIAFMVGGEELHNNHHAYPGSARLSLRPYEFDIGWLYIRVLEVLGMARVNKVAPRLHLTAPRAVVDGDTLKAVLTHRYEVLAKYLASLKRVAGEELTRLKVDSRSRRQAIGLLSRGASGLPEAEREQVGRLLACSPRLSAVYAMRGELEALWARSSASREQLVSDLQDWIARAEASGIRQLREFSLRLRRYAV
jgi:stearoyl-CoA desaturase (Delta-9 desaturase)